MPQKEIQPDPRQLAPIEEALHQANAGLSVIDATISRLLETAFHNPALARQRLTHLVRRNKLDATIAALENRHLTIGLLNVGLLRGSLFQPGTRRAAKAAVVELVTRLREADQLSKRTSDLERARHALIERADQARLQAMTVARERPRDRNRRR